MLNARKIQDFVILISWSFMKYPRKAFFLFIYEYNISMGNLLLPSKQKVGVIQIGHGQKGGNHLPTVVVRWQHMFSVMFLPFFFFVCNIKKANLYKIWPDRLKTFFTESCIVSNTELVLLITFSKT